MSSPRTRRNNYHEDETILPFWRITRETALLTQIGGSRLMIRQLAHEIKNPLGGLRGAAQLLARQLDDASMREYTTVIISEADRLVRSASLFLVAVLIVGAELRVRPSLQRLCLRWRQQLGVGRPRCLISSETQARLRQ